METACPVIAANAAHLYFPAVSTQPWPHERLQWLLELETDGTIRYSNNHPQGAVADSGQSIIGTNFFELPNVGDLGAFKRDFVSFVKGVKNRQTFHLRSGNGSQDSTAVVLTRSFDTTETGVSDVVVLMELKRV